MLEFHHNDPSTKEFNISHHMRKTFKNLLPEISKCSVLCANCHKEYHYLNNISGITTEEYLKSSK